VTLEAMITVVELQAVWTAAPAVAADPGRPAPNPDIVAEPTRLALFDLPDLTGSPAMQLMLAAASATDRWRPVPIEIVVGGEISGGTSALGETVMGRTLGVLPDGQHATIDLLSSVDVELANDRQWLESRDDDALLQGANLAAVGKEVIQFGLAEAIGPRRFKLSRLLRGRFGSDWATATHVTDEPFALLSTSTMRALPVPDALIGSIVEVTAHAVGDGAGTSVCTLAGGEALRPPSPVHLRAEISGGALDVAWVRRSRLGYSWVDNVDAALGESAERYRVRVEGSATTIEIEATDATATFDAAQLAALGSGAATISVVMVGDRAVSHAATQSIIL
jgi:hypothetical protein